MHIDQIANTVYITKLARPDETITSQEREKQQENEEKRRKEKEEKHV